MKTNLSKAFAKLRKMGYLAKQNYMCCSNCAGHAMTEIASGMIDAGKPKDEIRGSVFYHKQDTQHLRDGGDLYIAYGEMNSQAHGEIGISNVEAGKEVLKVLNECGLETVWDYDGNKRILVKAKSII